MSETSYFGVETAIPNELQFPPPVAVPAGIQQTHIRIPAKTSLPSSVTASQEITIEIPELSNCFLDPSTTALSFTVEFEGDLSKTAGTADLLHPVNSVPSETNPAFIIGSGWNLFNRYTLWLNGNVLADDISYPGLVENYLNLYTGGISWHHGNWHSGNMCHKLDDYGTSIGAVITVANKKGKLGTDNVTNGSASAEYAANNAIVYSKSTGHKMNPEGYVDSTVTTSQTFIAPNGDAKPRWKYRMNVTIPMMGILGANNSKLVPLFNGPFRLTLFCNDINNVFSDNTTTMKAEKYHFTEFEFIGTYLRVSDGPFQQILSALPTPGVISMRTTSFTYSNIMTSSGAMGIQEYPIAARRASTKMFLITWQPGGGSSDSNQAEPIEKMLCSVNPNLTTHSCIVINGEFYPKQGVDPLFKPMDTMFQNLVTMNMAYDPLTRPAFNHLQWLKCYSDVANHGGKLASKAGANGDVAAGDVENEKLSWWTPYVGYYKGPEHQGVNLGGGANPIKKHMLHNWNLLINTEHVSKRGFLSGTSTLTGSCFLKANHYSGIALDQKINVPGVFHIYTYFDAIVAFNLTNKSVVWRV